MITLNAIFRKGRAKSELNQLRRSGYIPYVLYAEGKSIGIGAVPLHEMEAAIRSIQAGFLPTTRFMLKDSESNSAREVIVKEIQYEPTSYIIKHLDFLELRENCHVQIKVPVQLLNTVDCVGVKLGGFLRYVMRHVKVICLPHRIPSHFELDVKELDIHQAKKIKDIEIPADIRCLAKQDDVVISVVKR